MASKPNWFTDGKVLVSNPITCGINKDGLEQFKVDSITGDRSKTEIDNELKSHVEEIISNNIHNDKIKYIDYDTVLSSHVIVPQYHDDTTISAIESEFGDNDKFELKSLQELIDSGYLTIFNGHGSPSSDQRIGDIPYIKVSDLRAGNININPSNMIPKSLAMKFWKSDHSGLKAYDLLSPERASKNIGEFSVLMPGQENIVLTKEIIGVRSLQVDYIDQFYLLWAFSLKVVRNQWNRIILMQTNREDVGERAKEIIIPFPRSREFGMEASLLFREYYKSIEEARMRFNLNTIEDDYTYYFRLT